jgi:hypothetical protein
MRLRNAERCCYLSGNMLAFANTGFWEIKNNYTNELHNLSNLSQYEILTIYDSQNVCDHKDSGWRTAHNLDCRSLSTISFKCPRRASGVGFACFQATSYHNTEESIMIFLYWWLLRLRVSSKFCIKYSWIHSHLYTWLHPEIVLAFPVFLFFSALKTHFERGM